MPVVEGDGEVEAVPELIRRVGAEACPSLAFSVAHPIRTPRHRIVKPSELERTVELAARRADAVLVLLDADDDCPAELGLELARRARETRPDKPTSVVLAMMEYEAWFLAAARSLQARGLMADVSPPAEPETTRDAKGRLRLQSNRRYSETLDQVSLTAQMDLTEARQAPSFDRCYREIERLLRTAPDPMFDV